MQNYGCAKGWKRIVVTIESILLMNQKFKMLNFLPDKFSAGAVERPNDIEATETVPKQLCECPDVIDSISLSRFAIFSLFINTLNWHSSVLINTSSSPSLVNKYSLNIHYTPIKSLFKHLVHTNLHLETVARHHKWARAWAWQSHWVTNEIF